MTFNHLFLLPSMEIQRRVLVKGAFGLIGQALQGLYKNDELTYGGVDAGTNWKFLCRADGDLRDLSAARNIFQNFRPTHVIHLAAKVGGVFANTEYPVEFLRDNLAIDQNILRLSHEFGVERLVACLSTCIFPDRTTYPINEEMLHNGPPHDSNFGYAYAKRMLDVSIRAYNEQYGCNFVAVVPTNLYGPHDNFGDGSHVVPALIRKFIDAETNGQRQVVVRGTGAALRQFVYSKDVAQLINWTLWKYEDKAPIILAGDVDHEVPIKQIVNQINGVLENVYEIKYDTTGTDGQYKKTASNAKLNLLLPDYHFTPLETGLAETIAWYRKHKDEVGRGK